MPRRIGLVPLEVSILRVVARRGEVHGFGIARQLRDEHGVGLTAHGTLYKALARLARWGMLDNRWEPAEVAEAEARPRRRLYRITKEGHAALAATVAEERVHGVVPGPSATPTTVRP